MKYLKKKLKVVDINIDAEKIANAEIELLTLIKSLKCDLCNAVMNSTLQAKLHYLGKSHKKKVSVFLKQNTKKIRHKNIEISSKNNDVSDVYCKICKIWFISQIDASQHYVGKKHLELAFRLSQTKRCKEDLFQDNILIDYPNQFDIGMTFESKIQIPCLQNSSLIISTVSQPCLTPLQCKLCGIFVNHENQLDIHKRGMKHLKMLKLYGHSLSNKDIFSQRIDYSIYRTPSD